MKLWHTLVLTVPPAVTGVFLAIIPVWILTSIGNMIINGRFFDSPTAPVIDPWGSPSTSLLDPYNLAYADMPEAGVPASAELAISIGVEEQENARAGRIGTVFAIVAFCCFNVANGMFFPRTETKRDRDLARRRVHIAEDFVDAVMAESKLHVHVMVFWNILCTIGTIIVLGRFQCRVRCDRDDGGVWVLFQDLPRLAVTGRLVVSHHGCLHLLHWSCDLRLT